MSNKNMHTKKQIGHSNRSRNSDLYSMYEQALHMDIDRTYHTNASH